MKILYMSQLFYPLVYGGGEYAFYLWAREFAKRGHEIKVITQRVKGLPKKETIEGIEIHRVGKAIDYSNKLNLNFLDNITYVLSSAKLSLKLSKWADIIHANTYIPVIGGSVSYIIRKKPLIVSVHDVYLLGREKFWKNWSSQKGVSKLSSFLGPITEKFVLKLPKTINLTGSTASVRDLIDVGIDKKKIRRIPYAIELKDFGGKKLKTENFILCISRLVFYKNVEIVIKAMQKFPDLKLVIVGDGPQKEELQKLASDSGISGNITFKGKISHEEKVKLFKKCLFLAQPSLVEGFGITIIEAFACEKPVLASRVAPMTELVKTEITGYTANPYDENEWAEKIEILARNKKLREQLGKNGRKFVEENFTIEKIADSLEKLYSKLQKTN